MDSSDSEFKKSEVNHVEENSMPTTYAGEIPKDETPWYKQSHLVALNFAIFSLVMFSSTNGYDGSIMNTLQSLPPWQKFMDHPTGAWLGFINAAQNIGNLITYPIAPWIAGKYGRKTGIWIGYFWLILATALGAAAPNPASFILARFFLGQVTAWFSTCSPLLITEISYPQHRGPLTSLYNCGWYVGSLLAAWTTYGTRNYPNNWAWRIPTAVQLALPLIALPGFIMCPESPRYLISKQRNEEARAMLVKYHGGGVNTPVVDFQMTEIETAITMAKEAKESQSYRDMLRTRGNLHRLFISITLGVAGQWNGVGVVSYYLTLVLETVGITSVTNQTLISGCLQIWNLIMAVTAALLVDRVGRRFLFMASCIGMLISYILVTGLSGSFAQSHIPSVGVAVVPFLFLYYGSYDIAFTPLLTGYPVEIWPYALRARGLAVTLTSTQLALAVNIFVNPIALGAIGWKYYIVFVVLLVIITLICWFYYPETKGRSLEEIDEIFDGEKAAIHVDRGRSTGIQVA